MLLQLLSIQKFIATTHDTYEKVCKAVFKSILLTFISKPKIECWCYKNIKKC